MGLLRWLFGARSRRIYLPQTDDQWVTQPDARPASQQTRTQWTDAQPAPKFIPAAALAPPPRTFLIEYTDANNQRRTRRVRPLFAGPRKLLTVLDTDVNRIKTHHLERIHIARLNSGGEEIDIAAHLQAHHHIDPRDFATSDTDRAAALDILRKLVSQTCIVRLVAEADGAITDKETAILMKYIKRDSRFAVRDDSVSQGDKRNIWPIVLDAILALPVAPDNLNALLATMFSDWENPRRFAALGDALTEMANLTPSIHPNVRSMIATINGFRQ